MNINLAAVIVHDIKNALGVLEGELRGLTVEPSKEQALHAHETCIALRDKLNGFLTLYKASSQGLAVRMEATHPEDFLRGLVRDRIGARPELQIAMDGKAMPMLGFFDENLVGLALEAALQNATRFARTRIDIACSKEADELVFSIRDDGPGLGAKEETLSTGLGMELCRTIAQAHRKGGKCGSVSLEDHPAGGAVFSMRLP